MDVKINESAAPQVAVAAPVATPTPAAPQIEAMKGIPTPPAIVPKDGLVTVTLQDGRSVTIKKMGPMDRMRLCSLIGAEDSKNELYLSIAAPAYSVVQMEGQAVARPTQKFALEALAERIGDKAIIEITIAIGEHFPEDDMKSLMEDFAKRQAIKNL